MKIRPLTVNGVKFYPLTIAEGVVLYAKRETVAAAITRLEALIEENRVKPMGSVQGFTTSTKFAKNSIVALEGESYISTKETTGVPSHIVTQGGNVVTYNGQTVVYGSNTNTDWTRIS